MRIYHPPMPLHGAERENSYIVHDMAGVELGQSWLHVAIDKESWPERPLRILLHLDAHPAAREMLFGAAVARAKQIRALRPDLPGRILAQCHPQDIEMMHFYQAMGFDETDGIDMFRWQLTPSQRPFFPPVGTQIADTFLETRADVESLLMRVNKWSGQLHALEWMQEAIELPYFLACGVYSGKDCLGEILLTGSDGEAVLEMLYVVPAWRRHHIGTAMLLHAKDILIQRGAVSMRVKAQRSNHAAIAMMQTQRFDWLDTVQVCPGMDI